MSFRDWRDWQIYMHYAPFGEERADIRGAQICQTFVNMNRDTKAHPNPIPLKEFVLQFGDALEEKKQSQRPQTPGEMQRHISDWVAGTNQIILEEKLRGIQHGS